jgi:hypothetical protein
MKSIIARLPSIHLAKSYFSDGLLAQLARRSNQRHQVAGTYTNEDIKRLNQQKGIARYDGKTERLE